MLATAGRANFGIIHGFDNLLGTKYLDSTAQAEWIMIRFVPFDDAERTWSVRSIAPGRHVRVSVLFLSSFISDRFDSHIHM